MNYKIVFRLLGYILLCEAGLLLLPAACSAVYAEWSVLGAFVFTAALCAVLGFALSRIKPSSNIFYMREGFVTTSLCWVLISVMGAIPLLLTGTLTDPVEALFEIVSGFTTTGASMIPSVEDVSHGVLFWRSFTHWIGGMGVIVFLLSLLPLTGGSHVNLMKAESPGPQVDKLVPKVQSTAKILYGIYIGLTVMCFICLLLADMPLFDAMLGTFGTAGTGGFGFKNDGFASYSPAIQWIITIFMILFGVNFNCYFLILLRRFGRAVSSEEVRSYFAVIFAAIGIIAWSIRDMYSSLEEILRNAAFQVGSIITTTGYSNCDFNCWPPLACEVLLMLMFVGACAGSTGGGIKVSRLQIWCKSISKEMQRALHPNVVSPVVMDGKPVAKNTLRTANIYMAAYFLIFVFSMLIISFDGFDMVTNFSAIAATFNNIGPGFSMVGPMSNFSCYSSLSKLVMIFDMLAGRLEIFPVLALFMPETWKRF